MTGTNDMRPDFQRMIKDSNKRAWDYVLVVKIDSTTGNTIPCSGIGFHIYDPSGNQIQMAFTYPTVTTIDTFYTDGDGMLITPEKLEYGKGYSLVEVSAPYGYVLNSDPVYFDITEENSTEENAVTVVVVTKENAPQMGVITVKRPASISLPSSTPRTAGVWSIVMGVFFAIAQKNEDKEKARKMIKNYVIGLVVIFAIFVACPYLVKGIAALIAG